MVPFIHKGDAYRQAWLLNLGVLRVQTPELMLKDTKGIKYDEYNITLEDLTFKYFQDFERCRTLVQQKNFLNKSEFEESILRSYNVIENFSVTVTAKVLKDDTESDRSLPKIQVDGCLPKLDLSIQPTIYEKILKIGDCFVAPLAGDDEVEHDSA